MSKVLLCLLLLLLVVCVCIFFFIVKAPRIEIPFLAQGEVCFGSSSREIEKFLGAPIETEKHVCDTNQTAKYYRATILGNEADVTCHFSPIDQLVTLKIDWELDSEEKATELYSSVSNSISKRYSNDSGYYCYEDDNTALDDNLLKMGVNFGATGIDYSLNLQGTLFSVVCTHLY